MTRTDVQNVAVLLWSESAGNPEMPVDKKRMTDNV
jgi:hypothetical protein